MPHSILAISDASNSPYVTRYFIISDSLQVNDFRAQWLEKIESDNKEINKFESHILAALFILDNHHGTKLMTDVIKLYYAEDTSLRDETESYIDNIINTYNYPNCNITFRIINDVLQFENQIAEQ